MFSEVTKCKFENGMRVWQSSIVCEGNSQNRQFIRCTNNEWSLDISINFVKVVTPITEQIAMAMINGETGHRVDCIVKSHDTYKPEDMQ